MKGSYNSVEDRAQEHIAKGVRATHYTLSIFSLTRDSKRLKDLIADEPSRSKVFAQLTGYYYTEAYPHELPESLANKGLHVAVTRPQLERLSMHSRLVVMVAG